MSNSTLALGGPTMKRGKGKITLAMEHEPHLEGEARIQNVIDRAKLAKFKWRVGEATQINIPIFDINHWYMISVFPQLGHAVIVDSFPDPVREAIRKNKGRQCLQMLDLVFADEIELDFLPGFRYSTFPWASTILFPYDNFPVQPNAFDCGIFVIRNMQYFGKNWYVEDEYVSNDHRASLAMECINHPHNEVVNELLEMVEAFARST